MLVLAALLAAATASAPAPPVQITAAYFGVYRPTITGELALGTTNDIWLEDLDDFGWVIELKSPAKVVHWREQLTLPAAPETWGEAEAQGRHISSDGRTAVTERDQVVDGGAIFNRWVLAPGDPKGHYVITVDVPGAPQQRFEFDVH
jgi:hypothetical protein